MIGKFRGLSLRAQISASAWSSALLKLSTIRRYGSAVAISSPQFLRRLYPNQTRPREASR